MGLAAEKVLHRDANGIVHNTGLAVILDSLEIDGVDVVVSFIASSLDAILEFFRFLAAMCFEAVAVGLANDGFNAFLEAGVQEHRGTETT